MCPCREDLFAREVSELQQRCQQAESQQEQLAAEMPSATAPLLRQLEAMQHSAQQHAAAWAAAEAHLNQRLTDAHASAATARAFWLLGCCPDASSFVQRTRLQASRS